MISAFQSRAQSWNRTSDTRIFSPLLYQLSYLGILHNSSGDRIWTYDLRVMSPTSFQTAPPRDINKKEMGGGGFEPPKHYAADLQSVPFGHSGIHPFFAFQQKADDRTRTDNLLITNQLLCQLSHIGMWLSSWFVTSCSAYNWLVPPQLSRIEPHRHTFLVTPTGIEPVLPPWKGDVLTAWPRSRLFIELPE